MTKEWRYGNIQGGGTGPQFNTGIFGQPPLYRAVINLSAGETVIRTRLHGQVLLGMLNTTPSGDSSGSHLAAATIVQFGLYINKTLTAPYSPQLLPATPLDANWLQVNTFNIRTHQLVETAGPSEQFFSVFEPENGLSESFAQRGPCLHANSIYLVWYFANTEHIYWGETTTPLIGLWSGSIDVWALIDHAVT